MKYLDKRIPSRSVKRGFDIPKAEEKGDQKSKSECATDDDRQQQSSRNNDWGILNFFTCTVIA